MKLLESLRRSVKNIESQIEQSSLFKHNGDKGEFREKIISDFLKPYLPEKYSLGSGEIFSSSNESSKQVDIVIYDKLFSNILFKDSQNSIFPCEAVYGVIEVKSYLTTDELNTSIDNITSVKSLKREDSDTLDITPHYRLPLNETFKWDRQKRNPYLGVIFAYDGISHDLIIKELNKRLKDLIPEKMEFLPNFIFNYKKGYLIGGVNSDNVLHLTHKKEEMSKFGHLPCGKDTLPFFFFTINLFLNQILLKGVDLGYYWHTVFDEIKKQNT